MLWRHLIRSGRAANAQLVTITNANPFPIKTKPIKQDTEMHRDIQIERVRDEMR